MVVGTITHINVEICRPKVVASRKRKPVMLPFEMIIQGKFVKAGNKLESNIEALIHGNCWRKCWVYCCSWCLQLLASVEAQRPYCMACPVCNLPGTWRTSASSKDRSIAAQLARIWCHTTWARQASVISLASPCELRATMWISMG